MKKKWIIEGREFSRSKCFLIMKLTLFICLLSMMHLSASVYSQQPKIDLFIEDASVKEVLKLIEDQSDFFFLYTNEDIDAERKINVNIREQSIEKILDKIFLGTDLTYKIVNRQIVLTRKNNNLDLST